MKHDMRIARFLYKQTRVCQIGSWTTIGIVSLVTMILLTACANGSNASTRTSSTGVSTAIQVPAVLKPTAPFVAIRMLDTMHGWALTERSVLETTDGGVHWLDVSPAHNPITTIAAADFLDTHYAWIALPPTQTTAHSLSGVIKILYTADGGMHWQIATIVDAGAVGTDRPHFINARDGWIEVGTGAAMSHESVDIFQTTNGGQSWLKVASAGPNAKSGLSFEGDKTGLSFKDTLTGWATAYTPANTAWFYMSRDGGKTWQSQSLPTIHGLTNAQYSTTPPVFFGNDGLLPVQVDSSASNGIDLYVTHDGGMHWQPTSLTNFSAYNVYVEDVQHAWASNGGTLYGTSNGGLSWIKLSTTSSIFGAMSFVDASNGWAISAPDPLANNTLLLHTTDGGKTWHKILYDIE